MVFHYKRMFRLIVADNHPDDRPEAETERLDCVPMTRHLFL
jgi:hypothetical protein